MRRRDLTDVRTIIELIAVTTTTTGLTAQATHDQNWYPIGIKISNTDHKPIPLTAHDWHGEWNYTIEQSNPW